MENEELKVLVMDEIATEIKKARESKGWTLYKLAQETKVAAGHLSRIERGMTAVRVDVLQRICIALKLEISFPV